MSQHHSHSEIPGNLLRENQYSILLVDDNKVNQFLGKRILQNLGFSQITLSGSGDEALELIRNNHFDLLLTDVEMPGLSGYDLAKTIRAEEKPELFRMVIIALTANDADDDRIKALEAGIDDYLIKPYTPNELQEVLFKHFKVRETINIEIIPAKDQSKFNNGLHKVFDVLNNNQADIRQYLKLLSQQLPALMSQIKNGIIQSDYEAAFQAAHKLKSPLMMLGDDQLCEKMGVFIEDLRHKNDLTTIPSKFEELSTSLESLLILVNIELEKLT